MTSIIIHGGAGSAIENSDRKESVRKSLERIRAETLSLLRDGAAAREAVVAGCRKLEDEPEFNAGLGSKIQADGRIRMCASLMDGAAHRFTGAIHAEDLQHPIDIVEALQSHEDRVLAGIGVERLARELDQETFDPTTIGQLKTWYDKRREGLGAEDADDRAGGLEHDHHGTVGVAALDDQGRLAVGTSTGGRGHERPGRVSDSSMPAGNYATDDVAISCTGVGEDIIDEALAPRIATRVADGATLEGAFSKTFDEAADRDRSFGAIGLHADGHITWAKTTGTLLAAWHTPEHSGHALNATTDPTVKTF